MKAKTDRGDVFESLATAENDTTQQIPSSDFALDAKEIIPDLAEATPPDSAARLDPSPDETSMDAHQSAGIDMFVENDSPLESTSAQIPSASDILSDNEPLTTCEEAGESIDERGAAIENVNLHDECATRGNEDLGPAVTDGETTPELIESKRSSRHQRSSSASSVSALALLCFATPHLPLYRADLDAPAIGG